MAIQLRRGDYADFDPSRLLDGELAIVLENDPDTEDGTGLYACFGDDNVKRVMTSDEQVDIPVATTTDDGLMSATDKAKLNGIATGATKNTASNTTPLMDGTAVKGSSDSYARADHVHPTDTSRASASDLTAHTGNANIHVTAAQKTTWDMNADWDETDSTSHAFIDNKPFGHSVTVGSSVLAQRRFGGNTANYVVTDTGGLYALTDMRGLDSDITAGSTYAVTVDGVQTVVTARQSISYYDPFDTSGTQYTGPALLVSGACLIVRVSQNRAAIFLAGSRNQTVAEKTVSVNTATETTTQISPEYLPVATYSSVGAVKPDGTSITIDANGTLHGASTVTPSSTAPQMDGTASAGSSNDYARADHVHPTDTSRAAASDLTDHVDDTTVHVTSAERTSWNAKADESDLTSHTSDTTAHVTQAERAAWDAKASTDTATISANGLMSASDKSKLDGIGTKANGYYTTEVVNGDRVLTLVYDLIEE